MKISIPPSNGLPYAIYETLKKLIVQLNNLTEGFIYARHNATDLTPTEASSIGDVVPKLTITEAGSGYIHRDWIYGNQGASKVWLASYTGTAPFGSMAYQNANAVAITGGTINGTTIGATTPAAITGTTIVGDSFVPIGTTMPANGWYVVSTVPYTVGWSIGSALRLSLSATAFTSTVPVTGSSFIPSGSTIPTNGMYLPAANTLGWAVNSVLKALLASNEFSLNIRIRITDGADTRNAGAVTESDGKVLNIGINDGPGNRFGGAYTSADQGGFLRFDTRAGEPFFSVRGRVAGATTEPGLLLSMLSSGSIGIGGTPDAAALLDVSSTTKGFLPPRLTTAQRDAITAPPSGLVIYNTTTGKLNVRGASAWEAVTSA